MSSRKNIVILGVSGSIGSQTLDIVRKHGDKLNIVGMSVNTSVDKLMEASREFEVSHLVVADKSKACDDFALQNKDLICFGQEAVIELAKLKEADIIVNALSGAAGLYASEAALRAGKILALANKESLVVGGDILIPLAKEQ
ncbi:MAG: 1-deoxy-D-xylulose-5-phosphate reductoisomerase, partial [Eggerthellaceae bacterium]|nr:1-deoxy-D-xylulose-5-phosphate reductoisomerase [Eggerthellaceae bacterium]